MNKIIYYVSITLLTVVSSCGNKETNVSRKLTLDNCPVIAQVINLQGDPVTDLDFFFRKGYIQFTIKLLAIFLSSYSPRKFGRRTDRRRTRYPYSRE